MLPNSSEKVSNALRGEEQIENKTNRKAQVEIKAENLPLLALSGSRINYAIHMFIMKMVKQKKKEQINKQTEEPKVGEAFFLSVY